MWVFNEHLCAQGDSSSAIQERRSAESFLLKLPQLERTQTTEIKRKMSSWRLNSHWGKKTGRRHERFGEFARRKESCPTHNVLLTAQAGAGELLLPLVMPRPDSRRFPWAESWGKAIPTGLSACTAGTHTSSASPRTNPAHHTHQSFCCLALGLTQAGTEAGIWSRNCWQQLCRIAWLCRMLCI